MIKRALYVVMGLVGVLALAGVAVSGAQSERERERDLSKVDFDIQKKFVVLGDKLLAAVAGSGSGSGPTGTSYRVRVITIAPKATDATQCSADVPWPDLTYRGASTLSDQVIFQGASGHTYTITFQNAHVPLSQNGISTASAAPVSLTTPSADCVNGACAYPYDIVDTAHPSTPCNSGANLPPFNSDGLVVHGGN